MKCPSCKEPDLLMTERQSIEIDYCPACRGVWLDRGELDRLIEKAQAEVAAKAVERAPAQYKPDAVYRDGNYRKQYKEDDYYKHQKHYKRKSLLSEIFDF
jgi:Zn-finger nucleic acid-binding protein